MGTIPVFVVEDSQHMQSALRDLLAVSGPFEVVGTAEGEMQATEWLMNNSEASRVAILDLVLADGTGFGLLQRVRSDGYEGKVIVFSEFASPAVKERCRQLGADAVFLKSEMESFIHYLEHAALPA